MPKGKRSILRSVDSIGHKAVGTILQASSSTSAGRLNGVSMPKHKMMSHDDRVSEGTHFMNM